MCAIIGRNLFHDNESYISVVKTLRTYSKESKLYFDLTQYPIDLICDMAVPDPKEFLIPRIADVIDEAVETALQNKKATALFKTTNGLTEQRLELKDLNVIFRFGTKEFHQKNDLVETTENMIRKSSDCENIFHSNYGKFLSFSLSIKPSSEQVKYLLEKSLNDWSIKKAHDAIVNEYEIIINSLILQLNHLIAQTGEAFSCLKELEALNDQLHKFIEQIEKNINGDIDNIEREWKTYFGFKDKKSIEEFKSILGNTDRLNKVRKEQIITITKAIETLQNFKGFLELRRAVFKKEEITKAYLSAQINAINESLNKLKSDSNE